MADGCCFVGGGSTAFKYRGVRKRKWGRWVSDIRQPNSRSRIWLGSYDTPEEAARAFDAATYCLRGRDDAAARFNFPDDLPTFTIPAPDEPCLTDAEIQTVATMYALRPPATAVRPAAALQGDELLLLQAGEGDQYCPAMPTASDVALEEEELVAENRELEIAEVRGSVGAYQFGPRSTEEDCSLEALAREFMAYADVGELDIFEALSPEAHAENELQAAAAAEAVPEANSAKQDSRQGPAEEAAAAVVTVEDEIGLQASWQSLEELFLPSINGFPTFSSPSCFDGEEVGGFPTQAPSPLWYF